MVAGLKHAKTTSGNRGEENSGLRRPARRWDQRQGLEGEFIDEGGPQEKRPRGTDEGPKMQHGDCDDRLGKRPRTLDAE